MRRDGRRMLYRTNAEATAAIHPERVSADPRLPPEVIAAWVDAAKHFVNLADLRDKVGDKIAKLIGVEAALVTTGAAGSILLGTAAVVTLAGGAELRVECVLG